MSHAEIKKIALSLFSQKGFEGTTIKEIAALAGLKPSSLYSHINSKESLFMEIWDDCISHTLKSVESINQRVKNNDLTDSKEVLYLYYSAIIKHFIHNKSEYLFLKQTTFFTNNKNIKDDIKEKGFLDNDAHAAYFSSFFIDLQKKDHIINADYEDLFFCYVGTILAYLEGFLIYNIKITDTHIDKLWDIFWRSIKK